MKNLLRSSLLFVAIFIVLYLAVYGWAERLQYRTGRSNALFKIESASTEDYDWVILGASHAMPLDFDDFNALMEREAGVSILNLASPGTGPLYNRFLFENFLRDHRARHLLYVVDGFTFLSRDWNEERFEDAKLIRRTPFKRPIACSFLSYIRRDGISPLALLDYVSGFSKINNPDRFRRDEWEGEAQFDRVYRPSATMLKKRIDYLYPSPTSPETPSRYAGDLADLVRLAQDRGMDVVLLEMPVPAEFRRAKPDDTDLKAALSQLATERGLAYRDLSTAIPSPEFYFDTDHLNRRGATEFFERDLKLILRPNPPAGG